MDLDALVLIMEIIMKVNGLKINFKEKANSLDKMVIFFKAIGLMIKFKEQEFQLIMMEINIKVNGKII